jgi:D-lactate dehydrogenase
MRKLAVEGHAALLVEWQSSDQAELDEHVHEAERVAAELPLSTPARLSGDAAGRASLWHIRKGLYAAVAGARPSGTTALLEDVAVPVGSLADTCSELTELFDRHDYLGSVIFGHAKDGNLHFMVNEHFTPDTSPDRYAKFTEEMVEVVLAHGGTLKAEHGTGRVMAPFVRRQFGDELHAVMREVKSLCDPSDVLNPGVVLTDDDDAHLRHLKTVVTVEPEVDRCVECGFCEPVCPSADLTTTPRQRIALRRELTAAEAAGDTELAAQLRADYEYDAVQTCAADGMCQTACPVLINTADLMKRLRKEANGRVVQAGGRALAGRWDVTTRAGARALDLAAALPPAVGETGSRGARALLGDDRVPQWRRDLPRGGVVRRPSAEPQQADAVYLPSCLNTLFAPESDGPGVLAALRSLAARAGVRLLVPDGVAGVCCGTPWSSKGLPAGQDRMRDRVRQVLGNASNGGTVPVITDAASCAEGFAHTSGIGPVTDAVAFVASTVLPRLAVTRRLGSLAVHPTCSSTRMGTNDALLAIAAAVADEVVVPDDWRCCGFAGDRGMLHPELTASATAPEAANITSRHFDAYASVNRTCEIGMTRATGRPYRHILELLDEATR